MESLILENDGQGIFTVVHDMGKNSPVIVMFHGFTGNHIENRFIFARLSRSLEKAGISSIRFDFRGSGNSDGTFEDMTLSSEISDARVVVDYAKSRFDAKIGVLGLSMGGTVALLSAPDLNPDALCLWAPASKNAEIFALNGMPKELENSLDVGGISVSPDFVREIFTLDAFSNAKKYAGPVSILHGTDDPTVPFKYSQALVEEFKNATLFPVESSNHTFTSVEWSTFVINKTVEFFSNELI